jgi:hypothetical protein
MPLTTYTPGEVLTAASLNDNFTFAASNPTAPAIAIFNETQAANTQGGTFTSGSYVKRTLNTTVTNGITGCTLTSSVIALPAGTYRVYAVAPACQVEEHQTRLQNTSDATTIAVGLSQAAVGTTIANTSYVLTHFTLATTKNIEFQHRCTATRASYGLGVTTNFGNDVVYSMIEITKLA